MNITCPECGGDKIVYLGDNMFECCYCDSRFKANATLQQLQQLQQSNQYDPQKVSSTQSSEIEVTEETIDEELEELYGPGCFVLGLSFFIPIVGIILYFKKRENETIYAKACLQYAITSICVGTILGIVARFI
ncbi:MAG: hypothetical protein KBT34_09120 [Prevotella sp.]|nr:hypothetical protein [Candidatus Prevotella equi]